MSTRVFIDAPLGAGAEFALPGGPARHVQVLRLQPGAPLRLFDGEGGEWDAVVTQMGRSEVRVRVGAHVAVDRELARHVTLAIGMPANERMDALIEKATELGVAAIVPLMSERSVLRLQGERAVRKLAHWRGVAIAACEQSGRTRLPRLHPVATLADWLQSLPADAREPSRAARWLLSAPRPAEAGRPPWGSRKVAEPHFLESLEPDASGIAAALAALAGSDSSVCVLSGPEGGLSPNEQALARRSGFAPVGLGPRVLRADTAPLAALAAIAGLGS